MIMKAQEAVSFSILSSKMMNFKSFNDSNNYFEILAFDFKLLK